MKLRHSFAAARPRALGLAGADQRSCRHHFLSAVRPQHGRNLCLVRRGYRDLHLGHGGRRRHPGPFRGDRPREYGFGYIIYSRYDTFTGEDCSGYGYLTDLSINPGLTSGTASTIVTLNCRTLNPDTGAYEDSTVDVIVTARLEGYGETVGGVYSYRYNDPSHYNTVSVTSGSLRSTPPRCSPSTATSCRSRGPTASASASSMTGMT